ncbi:MAG TPA: hypothetical protein VFI13_05510 [Gemmatimonadales bacterium]|nr:hypothetical protein [Gemmatimonadales bacterium]
MSDRGLAVQSSSLSVPVGATARAVPVGLDLEESAPLGERLFQWFLVALWLAVAAGTLAYGFGYYRLPLAQRADSPLDDLLRPSGLVGQGYGVVGTFLITFGVGMYSLRKRVPFLRRWGQLHQWLQAHVFLCTLGPFLVLLHTGFKFGGIVSIAFWSMTAVAVSGLFGRFVYGHIPRALHGQRTSLEALRAAKRELMERITAEYPAEAARVRAAVEAAPPAQPRGLVHALAIAIRYDIRRRGRARRLRHAVAAGKLPRVLQHDLVAVTGAQTKMEQQMVLLQPFQRLFHYWHIFHLPLTVVMFVVLGIHIAVAVMLGYTWIF